jgi:hypothetical protein
MVAENGPEDVAGPVTAATIGDADWVYARLRKSAEREEVALEKGDAQKAKAERDHQKWLLERYEIIACQTLGQAREERRPALEWLGDHDVLQTNEAKLVAAEREILALPGLEDAKKKRWVDLIERARTLQRRAKSDIVAMWAYIGRDKETGKPLHLAPIHIKMLQAVNSPEARGVIIMAPPGHGKSTTLEAYPLWVWGHSPERRIAIIRATDDQAAKVVNVLRQYINNSLEYRALFPRVRILGRSDPEPAVTAKLNKAKKGDTDWQVRAPDNSHGFTIARPNWSSTEPSVEAVPVMGRINGNGYDILLFDDPCPEDVLTVPSLRTYINEKFFNVHSKRLREPKTARIVGIGTPWAKDDLYGVLIGQVESGLRPGWKVLVDEFRIKDDANGTPIALWPERFDSYFFLQEKQTCTASQYARLYELRCASEVDRPVRCLQYYAADADDPAVAAMHPEHQEAFRARLRAIAQGERILSIDPSATRNKTSTETAVVEFSLTPSGHAYVVDAHFLPGDPSAFIEWLLRRIVGAELYGARRIQMPYGEVAGDDEFVREEKRRACFQPAEAMGRVDCLLWEWSGGMVSGVSLSKDLILKALMEMNVRWNGSQQDVRTTGFKGGNQLGKEHRLRGSAPYLQNGMVKFPGRYEWNKNIDGPVGADGNRRKGVWQIVCSTREPIAKLVKQLLEFNHHRADGADCVTQFILKYSQRLEADLMVPRQVQNRSEEFEQPAHTALRNLVKAIREARQVTEGDEEEAWLTEIGL